MPNLRRVGRQAEDQAANYLISQGYTIITRRFKSKSGEIDLVALDPQPNGEILVFVEVKYRSRADQSPENAVGYTKQQHFQAAVSDYFAKTDFPRYPARLDVIAVDPDGIKHFKDAFRTQS